MYKYMKILNLKKVRIKEYNLKHINEEFLLQKQRFALKN